MIFGLEPSEPLPQGWTPLECVAVIKCLDETGEPTVFLAATSLPVWDSVGLLTIALDVLRDSAADLFRPEPGSD